MLSLLVMALVLGVGGCSSAVGSDQVHRCNRLAFSSERNGNVDIYALNSDGTHLRRLTRSPGNDRSPVWSPDGSRIAFRSDRDGNDEIYAMDADGSRQVNVSDNAATDYSPTWSPDGQRIAFASDRTNDGQTINDIWVMDADGSNPDQLERRVGIDEYPVWSRDGKTIAFACTRGVVLPQRVGDFEVCAMHADGSDQRVLTDAAGISLPYSWSPDSRRIAFESSRRLAPSSVSSAGDVYTMKADGSRLVRLTHGHALSAQPAWSCDGSQFAFTRLIAGKPSQIWLLHIADGRLRQLTRGGTETADPSWRP